MLKHLAKIAYYDEIINNEILFVNKEYKSIKKQLISQSELSNNQHNILQANSDNLKIKEKETICKIEGFNIKKLSNHANINNIKSKFQDKLDTLHIFKKDLEEEIFYLEEKIIKKLNEFDSQNEELINANRDLELNLIVQSKRVINEEACKDEILVKRMKIAEKYKSIKDLVGRLNEKDNQKTRLINNYIHKINDVTKT